MEQRAYAKRRRGTGAAQTERAIQLKIRELAAEYGGQPVSLDDLRDMLMAELEGKPLSEELAAMREGR